MTNKYNGFDFEQVADCIDDCGLYQREMVNYLEAYTKESLQKALSDSRCHSWCLDNEEERNKLINFILEGK